MAAVNQTTQTMGQAMRQARCGAYIPRAEVVRMLKISEHELTMFETGQAQVPMHVMQTLFMNGYLMMRARYINNRYMEYASRLRGMGMLGIPDADDFDKE